MIEIKQQIEELINNGEKIVEANIHNRGDAFEYINGPDYESWISEAIFFLNEYYNGHILTDKFIKASENAVGNGLDYFNTMIGVLKALQNTRDIQHSQPMKEKILFISHSIMDLDYIKLLVNVLTNIGLPQKQIFCSSIPGYGIPLNEKIYDYLKKQFNKDITVLFVLSDNYYNSVACLNEMGATWVTTSNYISLLLPSFEYAKIKGAIDPTVISFKVDDKYRLTEFKNYLINLFELNSIRDETWELYKDEFLEKLEELKKMNKFSTNNVIVGKIQPNGVGKIKVIARFINKGKQPVQCQELIIKLIDTEDNELTVNVDSDQLDKFIIYGDENRRELLMIEVVNSSFNPRRLKSWKTEHYWADY